MGEGSQADDDLSVSGRVARVSSSVHRNRTAVIDDVRAELTVHIPTLDDDGVVLEVLEASIEENVDTLLHMLQHDIPLERVEAPMAALEYARRLAQRNVPVTDLIRAYRLGQARFLHSVLTELGHQPGDAATIANATVRIVEATSAYIDKASESVVTAYQHERERWLEHRNATRSNVVRRMVAGDRLDVTRSENELGYHLRRTHLGLVAWVDDRPVSSEGLLAIEDVITKLAAKVAGFEPPLTIPCDSNTWWCWIPVDRNSPDPTARLVEAAKIDDTVAKVHLAVGEPASGPEGFVQTHRQALAARSVVLAGSGARPSVVPFNEVGPLALMCADLDLTRAWVLDTLGPLAGDAHARLRETLRVYLANAGSYTRTAAQLMLHRNSVQYRLRRAAEIRGRGWEDDRLAVELALHACHWFGNRVLGPGRAPGPED